MTEEKTILPQLPKSWVWTELCEVGDVASGGTPSTKDEDNFSGEIPWLTPSDLTDFKGKYISKGQRNLTQKGLDKSSATLLPTGTILFSSRAPIGYVAIAKNSIATNQGFKNLIPYNGIFNDYIFYYLKANKLLAESYASGTTFLELSASRFARLPIPLPPTLEQHRIATKLEEYLPKLDAGVESLRKVKAQLQRYRQAVLKHAFEGKLTEEWRKTHKHEIEPASVLLERIKEERKRKEKRRKDKKLLPLDTSELPQLPESWQWVRTADICEGIVPGRNKPKEFKGQIPWISLPDVNGLYISKSMKNLGVTREDAEKVGMKVMQKGTVLISCVGRFGIICIASCPVVPNQQFHGFLCYDDITPEYVTFSLMTQIEQMKKLSAATTIAYMNKTKCNSINIPLAPLTEQNKLVEEIETRFSVADEIEKVVEQSLMHSERLRQSILKEAFKGRLVPQDPTDEPAEKLLERIREEKEKRKSEEKRKRGKKKRKRNSGLKQVGLIRYVK